MPTTDPQMLNRTLNLISDCSGVAKENLIPQQRLGDIGMDSLDFDELMMGLESEFHIRFLNEDGFGVQTTVGDVIACVAARIHETGSQLMEP